MKSKKQIKAGLITKSQDQLKERDEIADIIREELMSQLEGGSFWSELKEIVHQNKPAQAVKVAPRKSVRRINPKMKERGALVKKIMNEKGLNLAEASKYIKDNALL